MKNIFLFALLLTLAACSKIQKKDTGFVSAGKLRIFYESQGEGPPVLLLHAALQEHDMWDPQVAALRDRHRVITVDLPGHGQTTGNDTTILIADVLIRVLDSLHIQKTSVIGLSYGAACATDLVLAYPARVDKVVLVSAGITGSEDILKPDSISLHYFALLDSAFKKKDDDRTAAIFIESWCDGPFRKPEQVNKEAREYVQRTTIKNLKQHRQESWGNFSKETAAKRIKQIQNQVLIVYGEQDIPFILQTSHFLHSSISGSKEVMLSGVAHMLSLESANEFNGLVSVFLQ